MLRCQFLNQYKTTKTNNRAETQYDNACDDEKGCYAKQDGQ